METRTINCKISVPDCSFCNVGNERCGYLIDGYFNGIKRRIGRAYCGFIEVNSELFLFDGSNLFKKHPICLKSWIANLDTEIEKITEK
jgi:hypothetical protein